jgi:hypothetical protein
MDLLTESYPIGETLLPLTDILLLGLRKAEHSVLPTSTTPREFPALKVLLLPSPQFGQPSAL